MEWRELRDKISAESGVHWLEVAKVLKAVRVLAQDADPAKVFGVVSQIMQIEDSE